MVVPAVGCVWSVTGEPHSGQDLSVYKARLLSAVAPRNLLVHLEHAVFVSRCMLQRVLMTASLISCV